jgi:glycosyltransferase involved in cell wall biosynthesis
MKVLFIHQNLPGQYKHLAPALAARGNEIVGLTDERNVSRAQHLLKGIRVAGYASPRGATASTHGYLQDAEAQVRRGQAVARAALELRREGFTPDIVVGHPAWGECLFIKDVFPAAKLLLYAEFFYRSEGSDVNFDPEYPAGFDQNCRLRMRNTTQLVSMESADAALSPTFWQRRQYPEFLRDRISVVHDGIETALVQRRPNARFALPGGEVLTAADEVVTYVARNLEPYRGFHSFMRALPRMQAQRPKAKFVVVGGDDVSYGRRPPDGKTYREILLSEVGADVDRSRLFFLGRIPYGAYLDLLGISSVHVYLTYPFVLSWSMLEAMACNCAVVASRTPPVEEVIEDGKNGHLVDFFSPEAIADKVDEVLRDLHERDRIGGAARQTVLDRYDLAGCLPSQIELVEKLCGLGGTSIPSMETDSVAVPMRRDVWIQD